MAAVCQFWNATIYAPGEKESCHIGTLYFVDLATRTFYYGDPGPMGLQGSMQDKGIAWSATTGNLASKGGYDTLERFRADLVTRQEEAKAQARAQQEHEEYESAYATANTLDAIESFEKKYAGNDPDGYIGKLADAKLRLQQQAYHDGFENADTSQKLQKFIDAYQDNDPENLVPRAKKKLFQTRAAEAHRQQEAARLKAEHARNYVADLRAKYAAQISASSAQGMSVVSSFAIDCRAPDHRVLPLMNVLYATMAEIAHMGGTLQYRIENRGSAVRIYSQAFKDGRPLGSPNLTFEINEWGELRPYGITAEALLNSCFGSYGPIWTTSSGF
ncbi:hypothetical protein [Paraburkholderia sacchari]|uniref:hypothetical protein n=1 Tax=Paraburkholderia sacchari TaxID=159450 RepID=UPI003D984FA5